MPTRGEPARDCTRCGTCCFSESPRHARVTGDDYERLGDEAEAFVVFLGNEAFMRLEPVANDLHRCAALVIDAATGTFSCSLYARRPSVCRELERDGPACDGERFTKGERPKRALAVLRGFVSSRASEASEASVPLEFTRRP